jgi:hypothetical protein
MNCAQSDFVASRAAGRASSRSMEAGTESLAYCEKIAEAIFPRRLGYLHEMGVEEGG